MEELAEYYFRLKSDSEEKRRYIDFDRKNAFAELEKDHSLEGMLKQTHFNDETRQEELFYEEQIEELESVAEELRPQLKEAGATREKPLRIHIKDQTYLDVYLNEDDEIETYGYYTRM